MKKNKKHYDKYKKFDVVYADFGRNPHGVQGGIRPGIVVSCDASNHGGAPQISVVPLSSKLKDNPVHVIVEPSEIRGYALSNRSDFMPEDIQTLNKGCVRFKSGYIPGESEIREALKILEQNEDDVRCVYCGDKKTEWDHLHPLIINKKHTGYITEIANLVPACGKCNQSKGNSNWKEWMISNAEKSPKTRGIPDLEKRIQIIEKYDNYFKKKIINLEEIAGKDLWEKYQRAYDSIIFNMESAQKIMDEIKEKVSKQNGLSNLHMSDRPRKIFVVNPSKQNTETFSSQNIMKVEQIKNIINKNETELNREEKII